MSNLRSLFPDSQYETGAVTSANNLATLYVYNTNTGTPDNGGMCCLWIAPANTAWARFELWGAGGGGGGACCCQHQRMSGGSGTYARKTVRVVGGTGYTICAGSSTSCSQPCQGNSGAPSYACTPNSTYPMGVCAAGGCGGRTECHIGFNGDPGSVSCFIGSACGHDLAICGVMHGYAGGTCGYDSWAIAPEPTYIGGGHKISRDFCTWCYGNSQGVTTFPGAGGMSASTPSSGCYQGGMGAGGLVIITYK